MRWITNRHIFTGTRKIKHARRAFRRSRAPLETRAPIMLRVLETSIFGHKSRASCLEVTNGEYSDLEQPIRAHFQRRSQWGKPSSLAFFSFKLRLTIHYFLLLFSEETIFGMDDIRLAKDPGYRPVGRTGIGK